MSTVAVTVSDVMVAIADQLAAQISPVIEGIQVDPKQVRTPTPPCIDIYPGDPFLVPVGFGMVGAEAIYTVRARVTTADQQDGQELLLRMMDPNTSESIWAALVADPTFGGTVDDSTVETVSGFIPYDVTGPGGGYSGSLLAAEWRVKVELATGGGTAPIPPSPPSAPTLTAATAGDSQVTLTWSAPGSTGGAAITNYRVYRGASAGAETLLTTVGNVPGFIDTAVVNGTTYFYRVRAVNSAGDGTLSNELSATPDASGPPAGRTFGHNPTTFDGHEEYGTGVIIACGSFLTDEWGGLLMAGHVNIDASPGAGSSQLLRLVVFADDGTGNHPSTTLVGVTDEHLFNSGETGLVTFPAWTHFGGAPTLAPNTRYWLGAWWGTTTGASIINVRYTADAPALIHGAGSVTYSSTGNPAVSSWGTGSATRRYAMFFDLA